MQRLLDDAKELIYWALSLQDAALGQYFLGVEFPLTIIRQREAGFGGFADLYEEGERYEEGAGQ